MIDQDVASSFIGAWMSEQFRLEKYKIFRSLEDYMANTSTSFVTKFKEAAGTIKTMHNRIRIQCNTTGCSLGKDR